MVSRWPLLFLRFRSVQLSKAHRKWVEACWLSQYDKMMQMKGSASDAL